jgi:hypothetical protein
MYREPYHNFGNILPQFTHQMPRDIVEDIDMTVNKEKSVIKYSSSKTLPEEFADVELDLDTSFEHPLTAKTKTHVQPRDNFKLGNQMGKAFKNFKRYKVHK